MRKKFCSCKRTRWSKGTRSGDSANTKSNSKTRTVRDSVVTGRQRVQGRVLVGKASFQTKSNEINKNCLLIFQTLSYSNVNHQI